MVHICVKENMSLVSFIIFKQVSVWACKEISSKEKSSWLIRLKQKIIFIQKVGLKLLYFKVNAVVICQVSTSLQTSIKLLMSDNIASLPF